jgi:hypothetical protein
LEYSEAEKVAHPNMQILFTISKVRLYSLDLILLLLSKLPCPKNLGSVKPPQLDGWDLFTSAQIDSQQSKRTSSSYVAISPLEKDASETASSR